MFLRFDVHTGRPTTLIHETNSVWVNASYLFRNIEAESKNTFRFLWGSERCGFMHLYMYEYTAGAPGARLLGAVTNGKWSVESVEGLTWRTVVSTSAARRTRPWSVICT